MANNFVGRDMAVDLGTANTLVYVRGRGVLVDEPSVVAVNEKTGALVAQASETMFTESGEQTMRSAQASRPA